MIKRVSIVVLVLVVIFGGTFAWNALKTHFIKAYFKNYQAPPVSVTTYTVKPQNWESTLSSVGSVVAINSINVTSQVSGQIQKFYFKSGQHVKKGDPLIQLDDSIDQQALRNDQAQLQLASITYSRYQKLTLLGALSKSEQDNARANLIKAEAMLQTDALNISYKKILAPFDGKVGIRTVNLGQFVSPGNPLVSLQSIAPIFVDFNLPEQALSKIAVGEKVQVRVDAYPDRIFSGKIIAFNSTVEVNTRNIGIRAEFPNEDHSLYPGTFAKVKVVISKGGSVISVPQTAITYNLYGDLVYVVKQEKDKTGLMKDFAVQRFVQVGERQADQVEILKGLAPGDQVITSGQINLRNHSLIAISHEKLY